MAMADAVQQTTGWTTVITSSDYTHAAATHDQMPGGTVATYVRLSVDQSNCGESQPGYNRTVPDGTVRVYEFELYGVLASAPPTTSPTQLPSFWPTSQPTTAAPTSMPTIPAPVAASSGGGGSGPSQNTILIIVGVVIVLAGAIIIAVILKKSKTDESGAAARDQAVAFENPVRT